MYFRTQGSVFCRCIQLYFFCIMYNSIVCRYIQFSFVVSALSAVYRFISDHHIVYLICLCMQSHHLVTNWTVIRYTYDIDVYKSG